MSGSDLNKENRSHAVTNVPKVLDVVRELESLEVLIFDGIYNWFSWVDVSHRLAQINNKRWLAKVNRFHR